jgi:ribosomal protein S18 acetylase RimI-like enzyme
MSHTDSIEFRLATIADLDLLVALRAAFLAELTGSDGGDRSLIAALSRYFREKLPTKEFTAFVAEADGRIVATSGMIVRQLPPSAKNLEGREAFVLNVFTIPEFRGRGIATSLLQKTIAAARDARCGCVVLHASARAMPIYHRAGFARVDSEMRFELS